MATKTKTTNVEILNEAGQQLSGLKKVMLENKENPLVFNTLATSISSESYEKAIYESLVDTNVDSEQFNRLLMKSDSFTNTQIIKEKYEKLQKSLSNSLDRKGVKYFSTDTSLEKGGVLVIRKFGINMEFMKREFRLTQKEALKLFKDGFMEKYAQLKLKAVTKDMVAIVQKEFNKLYSLEFETSKFYYNEKQEVYSVDFTIAVNGQRYMNATSQETARLAIELEKVLQFVQKEFYRKLNGSKV